MTNATLRNIGEFLDHFERVKPIGKNKWEALCPAHSDHEPSLHISLTDDSKVLIDCKAGCPPNNIVQAVGLTMSHLFLNHSKPTGRPLRQEVASYQYHDQSGAPLFEVVRFQPKSFAQRLPDGTWGLHGVKPVIYHLDKVINAVASGEPVYICEGEKDADNLCKLGVCATTSPMGAGKWRQYYGEPLAGGSVVILPDNDAPGRAHARDIARSLVDVAANVKVVEMPETTIKDITDWLNDGLDKERLEQIVGGTPSYVPPPPTDEDMFPGRFNKTDLGNAERMVSQYGDIIRYCWRRKQWLIWDGKRWAWDDGDRIMDLAKLTVRSIYEEAAREDDDNERKALADHARRSENTGKIKAMVELAQSQPGIPVKISSLDADPWVLNCKSGTIDLRTGELKPHNKADLLTIMINVDYNPRATSELWDKFLDDITESSDEIKHYLQRAIGYSITGDNTEQVVFFPWGTGANGKSTLMGAFRDILGEYAHQADTDTFMLAYKNAGAANHKEDLANLLGKRFVVATELDEGRKLAVSKVKQITGGERIRARHVYEREIEFDVTFKIWLSGNHKPVITDTTYSIWRRVKLIPFNVVIPKDKQDLQLPNKLKTQYPALLAWAVQGCLDWQQYGLVEPDTIMSATTRYRHEQDILGDFIEDCCVLEPIATVTKSELKDEYITWCHDNSTDPITQRTFKNRLIEKGITEGRIGKARYWRGICLKTDEDGDNSCHQSDKTSGDFEAKVTSVTGKSHNFTYKGIQKKFSENGVTDVTFVTSEAKNITDVTKDVTKDVTDDFKLSNKEGLDELTQHLGLTKDGVLAIWQREGKPEIDIGRARTIADLDKFLDKNTEFDIDMIAGIVEWVRAAQGQWAEKHRKKKQ